MPTRGRVVLVVAVVKPWDQNFLIAKYSYLTGVQANAVAVIDGCGRRGALALWWQVELIFDNAPVDNRQALMQLTDVGIIMPCASQQGCGESYLHTEHTVSMPSS